MSENKSNEKSNYVQLKIPKLTLLIGGMVVAAFFVGYHLANYQQVGYETGFVAGYTKGINDLYAFNAQPDKWITLDSKIGIARINGTSVQFSWREGNSTLQLNFQSPTPLGVKEEFGRLSLMEDPIQIPDQISQLTSIQKQEYYVFQNQQNQRYLLQLAK